MEQSIQQRDDTSRIGEYFVPFLEGTIGRQDDRLAFVTPVNDLVEQIGRLVVKGQISDFIDAQRARPRPRTWCPARAAPSRPSPGPARSAHPTRRTRSP